MKNLLAPLMFSMAITAVAAPADLDGRKVALAWHTSDEGFHDSTAQLSMTLEDRRGNQAVREMQIKTLEVPGVEDGDKSLVVFESPPDVRGTALLSHAHILEPDDQWLYLPALGRIKRISSANRSGAFVGSEFAYEDIAGMELDKYSYRLRGQEACGDRQCAVVEQVPQYERSGYTRLVVWYDLTDYQPRKIDFYDRKNTLLKTLTFEDYRHHQGRFWRAHRLDMVNHQTGKRTLLEYKSIEFQTGLDASDFDRNALQHLR